MLDVELAQSTDVGKVREQNEDACGWYAPPSRALKRSHGWLLVLADGVGGQADGEVAAQLAVETLLDGFQSAPPEVPLGSLLTELIRKANTGILEASTTRQTDRQTIGIRQGFAANMATTVVACALRHDRAVVAHVGDSRCYRVRGQESVALTRDHTLAQEQLRFGALSAAESAESLNRHVLSRSLGKEMFVSPEVVSLAVEPGDVLLLCSDGLHGALTEQQIAATIAAGAKCGETLATTANRLVALAVERDGGDNTTAQLARVKAIERVGMYRGRPYRLP